MTWTATVTAVIKNEGNIVAAVQFVEEVSRETILRNVPAQDLTPDSLAAFCQRVIVGLEARDLAIETITVGPIVLPRDATDQATIDKLAAAAAADAFFVLYDAYKATQKQVTAGILLADAKPVTDAAAAMKGAFLPEYASDPRFR